MTKAARVALALTLCAQAWGQDEAAREKEALEGWKLGIKADAMTSFNLYSENWEGGAANAISWVLSLNAQAERQIGKLMHNKNNLKLEFGETHNQRDDDTSTVQIEDGFLAPLKAADDIDLESVLRFTLGGWVDPYIGFHLESQFWDRLLGAEDKYFNPVDLIESFGIAREAVKSESTAWQLRLAGSVRQHVDSRLPDPINDAGLEFISDFKTAAKDDRVTFASLLRLFEALFRADAQGDFWRHPDINWENTLGVSVTKYIMAKYTFQLLYDAEKDLPQRRPSWKQVASIGLSFGYKK